MAHYITQLEILNWLSPTELAILTGDPTGVTINSTLVNVIIEACAAEIDTYIKTRYKIPLGDNIPIPQQIQIFNVDLAIHKLYEIYMREGQVPEACVWRRLTAIGNLKKIAAGEMDIICSSEIEHGLIIKESKIETTEINNRKLTTDDLGKFYEPNA